MKRDQSEIELTREELLGIFAGIDHALQQRGKKISVTAIGGVSILLQGIRDRTTRDIDIADVMDAAAFQKVCAKKGIPVDIVTISSTVDFHHDDKVVLFRGKALQVHSVSIEDLVKLKLERFYKQDPEDIYAILKTTALPYERFKDIVSEMLIDFIGNPRALFLSAMVVVETFYPQNKSDFETLLKS